MCYTLTVYLRIVSIRKHSPTMIPVSPAMITQPKTKPGRKSGRGTSSISKKEVILDKNWTILIIWKKNEVKQWSMVWLSNFGPNITSQSFESAKKWFFGRPDVDPIGVRTLPWSNMIWGHVRTNFGRGVTDFWIFIIWIYRAHF